jgi:hypothetical protein
MIAETDKGQIEKSFSILRIIWAAMLGTLIIYLFICYQFGDQIRQPSGSTLKSPSQSDISPILGKYAVALIVSLALSESIAIYGLVLFFLGDNYQTLYFFVGISAIAMFFYRPKKEELEELIRAAMQGVDAPPSK